MHTTHNAHNTQRTYVHTQACTHAHTHAHTHTHTHTEICTYAQRTHTHLCSCEPIDRVGTNLLAQTETETERRKRCDLKGAMTSHTQAYIHTYTHLPVRIHTTRNACCMYMWQVVYGDTDSGDALLLGPFSLLPYPLCLVLCPFSTPMDTPTHAYTCTQHTRTSAYNIPVHLHTNIHMHIHTYIHTCKHTYIHT